MRISTLRAIGRHENRHDIAPDRAALRETTQNHAGVGRPVRNLHQCPRCLHWSPLAFLDCPRCKSPIQ